MNDETRDPISDEARERARAIRAPTLETPRLVLHPLTLDDAPATQQLFPHWDVVRYLAANVPWPYPPDGARVYYKYVALPAMERGDAWHWTLRRKSDAANLIGAIGVMTQHNLNRGFWLAPAWQRQGLMTEACAAVNDFWFDVLGFPVLRAPKAVANAASRRMSEKQGMRVIAVEEHSFVSGRLPAEIWELTREAWHARRAEFTRDSS